MLWTLKIYRSVLFQRWCELREASMKFASIHIIALSPIKAFRKKFVIRYFIIISICCSSSTICMEEFWSERKKILQIKARSLHKCSNEYALCDWARNVSTQTHAIHHRCKVYWLNVCGPFFHRQTIEQSTSTVRYITERAFRAMMHSKMFYTVSNIHCMQHIRFIGIWIFIVLVLCAPFRIMRYRCTH